MEKKERRLSWLGHLLYVTLLKSLTSPFVLTSDVFHSLSYLSIMITFFLPSFTLSRLVSIFRFFVPMSSAVEHMCSIVSFTLLRPRVLRLRRYDFMPLMVGLLLRFRSRSRLRLCLVTLGLLNFLKRSLKSLRMGEIRVIRLGFGLGEVGPEMRLDLCAMI